VAIRRADAETFASHLQEATAGRVVPIRAR